MLVLTYADGLGVNLHQLRQGILKPPGNGHGAAQVHIKLGEFLRRQLGGGVHGSARLIDNGVGQSAVHLPDQIGGHGLSLPGGGAVADGDMGHLMTADHLLQIVHGLPAVALGEGGIHHPGVQHLTGGVHHGDFAAVAVAGIQAHGHMALDGGLHQQGF